MFKDLSWVPRVLETEEEKQAQWKKETKVFQADTELSKAKDAEEEEKRNQRK
jgi:hypothetical protein